MAGVDGGDGSPVDSGNEEVQLSYEVWHESADGQSQMLTRQGKLLYAITAAADAVNVLRTQDATGQVEVRHAQTGWKAYVKLITE